MEDSGTERRKEERTLTTNELMKASLRPEGTEDRILGYVVDKSASGFQIRLSEKIVPQTMAYLTITDKSGSSSVEPKDYIVKIRWCKKDIYFEGFGVGVEIMAFASKK
jgi:hypothetical protein